MTPRMRARQLAPVLLILTGSAQGASARQAGVHPIDSTSTHAFLHASDASDDLSVVVGWGQRTVGAAHEAFVWRTTTGVQWIDTDEIAVVSTRAHAVSPDGSVVVGEAVTSAGSAPFRWSETSGFALLLAPAGSAGAQAAVDVSEDGAVVVGYFRRPLGQRSAFRWTAETGLLAIAGFGADQAEARCVSADGATVAGAVINIPARIFLWTQTDGALTGDQILPTAMSSDSNIVIGEDGSNGFVGVRSSTTLTTTQSIEPLDPSGEVIERIHPLGVSATGSFVVGVSSGTPFFWADSGNTYAMSVLLTELYGPNATAGWTLSDAIAVSEEGVVVGNGFFGGRTDVWIVGLSFSSCIADLSDDRFVDGRDVAILLAAWGRDGQFLAVADVNGDGLIDGHDLAILLSDWGRCP